MRVADQFLFSTDNLFNADTKLKPTPRPIGIRKQLSMMKRRKKYGTTSVDIGNHLVGVVPRPEALQPSVCPES